MCNVSRAVRAASSGSRMATELNPNSTDLTARNGFGKVDWVAAFVGGGLIVAGFAGWF